MNQEAQELVKQYIAETLKDEVYVQCVKAGNRYFIPADDSVV